MRRRIATLTALALMASLFPFAAAVAQVENTPAAVPVREVEAVVLEGAQLPRWAAPAAEGRGHPLSGHNTIPGAKQVRDAHNGELVVPPGGPLGVPVEDVVAYKWTGSSFQEIPVQVDERFPYFLANSNSGFAHYSGTDKELTYEWDVESWKKMFGQCFARYAETTSEIQAALSAGWLKPGGPALPPSGTPDLQKLLEYYSTVTEDPVATLDTDDEVVFMARDAGDRAPGGVGPPGTGDQRQEIALTDPRTGKVSFVYLFTNPGGPSFDDTTYVDYHRDGDENGDGQLHGDADEWIDRASFTTGHPENLGSSNTGYGPNIRGTVCNDPNGPAPARTSSDRFPRDGVTVSTDTYQWRATGRWMVRGMRITKPGTAREYGPDLIDRWKGRAFQQSPDSSLSLVGFEDEQVNWEGNAAVLGELEGPVRAVREIWGADSGTNVTKTETFYRDAVQYRYRVRVHPIPPDGLYTSWDYNEGVAHTYYNENLTRINGVPIDGRNDEVVGNIDGAAGRPAFFDAPDPTHSKPFSFLNWEQVSGAGDSGSLVYMFEMTGATSLTNPLVMPYYRDDVCLDDGTGDNPRPRPYPGEDSTDSRVYPNQPPCNAEDRTTWEMRQEGDQVLGRQGCFACHGVHFFVTHDTDNATTSVGPVNEIDGAQWQWAVPTSQPTNVGDAYANTVKFPLAAAATVQPSQPQAADPSPTPSGTATPSPAPWEEPADPALNIGCDPIDPTSCLLPFPNDFFTIADASTDTGRQIAFSPLAMPRNGAEVPGVEGGIGKPIDPTEWNRNDGFSPGQAVLTMVPGLDLHKTWRTEERPFVGQPNDDVYFDHRDHIADIGLYLEDDAPIVILEVNEKEGEGDPARHPFWSELDTHPDAVAAGEQLLMLRPARNFEEGERYIVALRNLKDSNGATIPTRSAFRAFTQAYETGSASDGRQRHFNEKVFPVLEAAGIDPRDLYLAWDFTVASEENIAGRMLHMRDVAFGPSGEGPVSDGRLGDTDLADGLVEGRAPRFIIDSTESRDSGATRRVRGRVEVPNFLDRIQQTTAHIEDPQAAPRKQTFYVDVPAPGSRLLDIDRDGLPDQNPVERTVMVPFVCDVAVNGKENIPGLYGHGLLGDRDQINDFNRSPRPHGPFFGCAADWWGMSTADVPTVAAILTDISNFPSLPDRAQQGFLNFMFLGRALVHPGGFATNPAFQDNGKRLIKTADDNGTYLVYDGNSQGGIMGGALVALSPDISRGILGVTGMNYSTLLNRSVDYEPPGIYSRPFYASYQDIAERQIVYGLMQMLWDRGEANGYAAHMTSDPYRNTPPHDVLLQIAWSDHQVANVSAEVEARTVGAPIMAGLEEHWSYDRDPAATGVQNPFYDPKGYPHQGSALVYWDSGNATPPNGNIPPHNIGDPHSHPRREAASSWQEAHFLLTGEMWDVCGGQSYITGPHPDARACAPPSAAPGDVRDGDGVPDSEDNCPGTPNPGQEDSDGDGTGDACEGDRDADGVLDDTDNCADVPNADQKDIDADGQGDECDDDDDGDGHLDGADNCAAIANPDQQDTDGDGAGNSCDLDNDGDGTEDAADNCPSVPNDQSDRDGDGTGDACDTDNDNDGVDDVNDNCPETSNPGQEDADDDGRGNLCDPPEDTQLDFTPASAREGQHSDDARFEIVLLDEDGVGIADQEIVFRFTGPAGARQARATTNADGIAHAAFELIDSQGSAQVQAFYDGREWFYEPSANISSFVVVRETTEADLERGGKGSKSRLTATLMDNDGEAVRDRLVVFTANGNRICANATPTDARGKVVCDIPARYQGGHNTFEAAFVGDDYYTPDQATTTT